MSESTVKRPLDRDLVGRERRGTAGELPRLSATPYADARWCLILLLLALVLWIPRFRGPLDLRYDAGVYHLLGTSLEAGKGYRILSEPGAIQGIQYPPLLPAVDALVVRALGTSDPATVGHVLRLGFFGVFLIYVIAVFALARRYLSPGFAFLAVLVTLLHVHTTFMSDLLFADFPFALVTVLFLLVATSTDGSPRRTWAGAVFTAAAFGLRTAGTALSAAWTAESVLRRRWREAALRGAVALLPILAWQGYVRQVKSSAEFQHPAYPYQRANYQFYNVGYFENLAYVDPFRPELGRASPGDLALRFASNLAYIPVSLGAAVNSEHGWWEGHFRQLNRLVGTVVVPEWLAYVINGLMGALVLGGLALLMLRGHLLLTLSAVTSIGLIVLTPWQGQFNRYLAPLTPLLAIALWLMVAVIIARTKRADRPAVRRLGLLTVVVVGLAVLQQAYTLIKVYRRHHYPATYLDASGGRHPYRLFFYDRAWQLHEGALDWLARHGRPGEIVATSTPHWAYLRTGLQAVMPPFELDGPTAERLLEAVPVTYLLTDNLAFVNVGQRYTKPALQTYPERWTLVYAAADGGSRVYRRAESAAPAAK